MSNNFMSFFNIFCLHKSKPSLKTQHKNGENEIIYSKTLDIAFIHEPSVFILQKNIYKIICSIQPMYFGMNPNTKSFQKQKTLNERNFKSFSFKTQSCWDFRTCEEKKTPGFIVECSHSDPNFLKNHDLIDSAVHSNSLINWQNKLQNN